MSRPIPPRFIETKAADPVEQGDIFASVPILTSKDALPKDGSLTTPRILTYDMVVLSQSCDLAFKNKIVRVQLAPLFTIEEYVKKLKHLNTVERLEDLRKNNIPRFYLLGENTSSKLARQGLIIADFGNIHSVAVATIEALRIQQPERLGLSSPYREQLSQHLARFYMRVGLPEDLPEFKSPV